MSKKGYIEVRYCSHPVKDTFVNRLPEPEDEQEVPALKEPLAAE
jgi:hypothetical protein